MTFNGIFSAEIAPLITKVMRDELGRKSHEVELIA